MRLQIVKNHRIGTRKGLVSDANDYRCRRLYDLRFLQLQLSHGSECRSQALTNVLVWRFGEAANPPGDAPIPGEPLLENIERCDVCGQAARALRFDSIVKNL